MNILLNTLRSVIDCALNRLERQAYRNALGHDFARRHSVRIFGAEMLSEVEAEEEVHEPTVTVDDLANTYRHTLLNGFASPQYSASKASAQAVEKPAAADSRDPHGRPAGPGKPTSELLYTAAKVITSAWFTWGEEDSWVEELPNLVHDLVERACAFKAIEDTP